MDFYYINNDVYQSSMQEQPILKVNKNLPIQNNNMSNKLFKKIYKNISNTNIELEYLTVTFKIIEDINIKEKDNNLSIGQIKFLFDVYKKNTIKNDNEYKINYGMSYIEIGKYYKSKGDNEKANKYFMFSIKLFCEKTFFHN
jgi:hypothetical protein